MRDRSVVCDALGKEVNLIVKELDTTDAKRKIDFEWWRTEPGLSMRSNEKDGHWPWADLVQTYSRYNRLLCPTFGYYYDGKIQGAMMLRLDAKSCLTPDHGAVLIQRIAAAPWNRKREGSVRLLQSVGEFMVCQAILQSKDLGFLGTVIAAPIPSAVEFYTKLGFEKTDLKDGDGIDSSHYYELCSTTAQQLIEHEVP